MSADLINSRTPILGTSAHALASPLPYGIGVYSIDSNGEKQALPVYFVSPKMALLRPRGVKPGGYVEAVPGTEFEIRTTAIQPKFLGVKGRKFRKGRTVDANVIVDGSFVELLRIDDSFEELVTNGFVAVKDFVEGTNECTEKV